MSISRRDAKNAPTMYLFVWNPILNSEWDERMLKACTSWDIAMVAKAMVSPRGMLVFPSRVKTLEPMK